MTSFCGIVVDTYILSLATMWPGVPAGITLLATSTGVGAAALLTRER